MVDRQDNGRPRSRRLPRAVRERQILDAAVEVFATHGFHTASMDEISEVAGISKPMLYAYLGAKDELFVACIRREAARLIEAISTAVEAGLSPDEQLWRGLQVFFEYVHHNQAGWTVLHRQANLQGEPFVSELVEWRERATSLIAALLAQATAGSAQPMQAEQTEPFAVALVGAGESLVEWWFQHPEHTAEGMAMRLMNMVWMGFGDLVEGRSWTPGS
ncbi:TetR/AcrR family transcriptional regulator [Saccharopolyspora shandongensis]|uniref:Transcriptional regulator, TetR family n=1 Tax=Saccharopolyspora shandongensis TaxID=418495 RepID=A0A1H2SMG8_9PSEU|nr:TetR/AcrR family transcriptional regulator [Saccharopolyspora shandongensis]SDW32229.1 transcriptional regulator, TetR family [Saccharopolyspora shandongensis]